jgi:hypothetical protein
MRGVGGAMCDRVGFKCEINHIKSCF